MRRPEELQALCEHQRYKITAIRLSGYVFFGSAVGLVKDVTAALEDAAKLSLDRQQYLVLDFHKVSGIDATAVRSCFLRLKQLIDERGAVMVMTG